MKHYFLNFLLIATLCSQSIFAKDAVDKTATAEREEIALVLKEIIYLREVVQEMQRKYANNDAKIKFNYQALLMQLTATENGIKEYLNARIQQIYLKPPATINQKIYEIRRN